MLSPNPMTIYRSRTASRTAMWWVCLRAHRYIMAWNALSPLCENQWETMLLFTYRFELQSRQKKQKNRSVLKYRTVTNAEVAWWLTSVFVRCIDVCIVLLYSVRGSRRVPPVWWRPGICAANRAASSAPPIGRRVRPRVAPTADSTVRPRRLWRAPTAARSFLLASRRSPMDRPELSVSLCTNGECIKWQINRLIDWLLNENKKKTAVCSWTSEITSQSAMLRIDWLQFGIRSIISRVVPTNALQCTMTMNESYWSLYLYHPFASDSIRTNFTYEIVIDSVLWADKN